MHYTNINGKTILASENTIAVDNGAFRYGYGLFETMLVQNNVIRLAGYHWERLFSGISQLQLELPAIVTAHYLEAEIIKTVGKNKLGNLCRVRLQVYAGGGGLYGENIAKAGYIIECFPLAASVLQLNENGLVAGISEGLFKSADALSNLKTCNALIYAIAARQAKANKWNDALIKNSQGNIIESTIANVFWVKDNAVYTPPLTEGCVAGAMRRHILAKLPAVNQKILTVHELMCADEVFLSNAIKGIKWAGDAGGKKMKNKVTGEVYAACLH